MEGSGTWKAGFDCKSSWVSIAGAPVPCPALRCVLGLKYKGSNCLRQGQLEWHGATQDTRTSALKYHKHWNRMSGHLRRRRGLDFLD